MAMNPIEIERKVRQLDGDVQSIYEMLAGIEGTQRRHGNRLHEITEKVDTLGVQVGTMGGQVAALDGKVDVLDDKVAALDGKVDVLDDKVAALDGKVDVLDRKLDAVLAMLGGPAASS